jgi:hypothetical protein
MRIVVLFLVMSGIALLLLDELVNRQPPKIEYRYLPRDLDAYLRDIPYAVYDYSKIFDDAKNIRENPETLAAATHVS